MHTIGLLDIHGISPAAREGALALMSLQDQQRYHAYLHQVDADRFLFGRRLAMNLIADISAREDEDIVIMSDSMAEKPYDSEYVTEFSISHSGHYVAVAVSDTPVGIDIQMHDQPDMSLFDSFLTDPEKRYAHTSEQHFYQIWTAVESLAKITALGFNESLSSRIISTRDSVESYAINHNTFHISLVKQTKDFTLTIATTKPTYLEQIPSTETLTNRLMVESDRVTIYRGSAVSEL